MMHKTKLAIYTILTLILLFAQATFSKMLVSLALIYVIWRLFKLVTHSLTCPTCLTKLGVGVIFLLLALITTSPRLYYSIVILLWMDYLLQDTNDYKKKTGYYG